MIGLLLWIIIGGVAGWLAGMVVQGGGLGLLGDIIVGIVGAFIGGVIVTAFGGTGFTGFNIWSLFVAFLGAVILLFAVRLLSGNRGMSNI